MTIQIPSEQDLRAAARSFIEALPPDTRIIDFSGPMGAGKTTFISALCRVLGALDEPSSPTFSIVNEYLIPKSDDPTAPSSIFHFDFFRLDSADQAREIGAEEYFDSGNWCLMEWAENVEEIIPVDTLHVRINVNDDGSRTLSF